MINYDGKTFRPVANTGNGETSEETLFVYRQQGNIITSQYQGGKIRQGQLMALVGADGLLDMRYHQVNNQGKLMTGICISVSELLPTGKLRLHENWQWTSGDMSRGTSILEEL